MAQLSIHRDKRWLRNGTLKQEANGALQNVQRRHQANQLTKQAVELFGRELVDDASDLAKRLFRARCLGCWCPRLQALISCLGKASVVNQRATICRGRRRRLSYGM